MYIRRYEKGKRRQCLAVPADAELMPGLAGRRWLCSRWDLVSERVTRYVRNTVCVSSGARSSPEQASCSPIHVLSLLVCRCCSLSPLLQTLSVCPFFASVCRPATPALHKRPHASLISLIIDHRHIPRPSVKVGGAWQSCGGVGEVRGHQFVSPNRRPARRASN